MFRTSHYFPHFHRLMSSETFPCPSYFHSSGVVPEERLVVQYTGQFVVERLMKFPE